MHLQYSSKCSPLWATPFFINHIPYKVILNINVLCLLMVSRFICQENCSFAVMVYPYSSMYQPHTWTQSLQPNFFLACMSGYHVFYLCSWKFHYKLSLAHPTNCTSKKVKFIPTCRYSLIHISNPIYINKSRMSKNLSNPSLPW